MGNEPDHAEDDLLRLNAFIDGELAPSERAEVAARIAASADFARAHATLARLKACVAATATATSLAIRPARPRMARRGAFVAAAASAAAAAIIIIAIGAAERPSTQSYAPSATALPTAALASLPGRPILPRLDIAGLTLTGIVIDAVDEAPIVTASYLGPHGCRLDLRIWPAGRPTPALAGSEHRRWSVDALTYELVGHGMPTGRFATIAAATERQTRIEGLPAAMEQRLREARASAPPCAG